MFDAQISNCGQAARHMGQWVGGTHSGAGSTRWLAGSRGAHGAGSRGHAWGSGEGDVQSMKQGAGGGGQGAGGCMEEERGAVDRGLGVSFIFGCSAVSAPKNASFFAAFLLYMLLGFAEW